MMRGLLSKGRVVPVLLKEEVLDIESSIINSGTTLEELIDRASSFVANSIYRAIKPHARILVLAGRGNNGEDAVNAALKLARLGYSCAFIFLDRSASARFSEKVIDERVDFAICFEDAGEEEFKNLIQKYRPNVILDGLFGLGFRRPLPDGAKKLISAVNSIQAMKVSVDIPSGVEANTAFADETSFKADLTVTFFALKPAHVLPPSSAFCGKTIVSALGFEKMLDKANRKKEIFKISPDRKSLHPYFRSPLAHKKRHAVLMLAGSKIMPGAAYLSAKSAFLAGATYVAVATERKAIDTLSSLIPEAVFIEINFEDIRGSLEVLEKRISEFTSFVVGPGLSREEKNLELATETMRILSRHGKKAVIDGDALYALSRLEQTMDLERCVLTPHEGEAKRFLDADTDLLTTAFHIAGLFNSVCVLKSSSTIVARNGMAAIVSDGHQNLATAGSGDVLAGTISAFLAYDDDPYKAALQAVLVQAKASRFLLNRFEGASVLSTEIAESFRIVLKDLCGDGNES